MNNRVERLQTMNEQKPPSPPADTPPTDLNQVMAERREKLKALRAKGKAYPNDFFRQQFAAEVVEKHEGFDRDALDLNPVVVSVAGRIMLRRVMGKASFATLQDMSGQIQLYFTDSYPGKADHDAFKRWDIGDLIGVEGVLFKTNKGEVTVRVRKVKLLAKSLRPLPDKFHGLTDQELKYRQRYVDLIMNEDTRLVFVQRTRIIQGLRNYLIVRRYIEVETPMLQPIPGGAAARPFVTHHNALDMDMYLRIAPELYLKRLVVGGFEKVFELNRNFRNEGISTRHNPEFTMLEFYAAYTEYNYLMNFIQMMLSEVAQAALGIRKITYQG